MGKSCGDEVGADDARFVDDGGAGVFEADVDIPDGGGFLQPPGADRSSVEMEGIGEGEVDAKQAERGCWPETLLPRPPLRHGLRPRHLSPNKNWG